MLSYSEHGMNVGCLYSLYQESMSEQKTMSSDLPRLSSEYLCEVSLLDHPELSSVTLSKLETHIKHHYNILDVDENQKGELLEKEMGIGMTLTIWTYSGQMTST